MVSIINLFKLQKSIFVINVFIFCFFCFNEVVASATINEENSIEKQKELFYEKDLDVDKNEHKLIEAGKLINSTPFFIKVFGFFEQELIFYISYSVVGFYKDEYLSFKIENSLSRFKKNNVMTSESRDNLIYYNFLGKKFNFKIYSNPDKTILVYIVNPNRLNSHAWICIKTDLNLADLDVEYLRGVLDKIFLNKKILQQLYNIFASPAIEVGSIPIIDSSLASFSILSDLNDLIAYISNNYITTANSYEVRFDDIGDDSHSSRGFFANIYRDKSSYDRTKNITLSLTPLIDYDINSMSIISNNENDDQFCEANHCHSQSIFDDLNNIKKSIRTLLKNNKNFEKKLNDLTDYIFL